MLKYELDKGLWSLRPLDSRNFSMTKRLYNLRVLADTKVRTRAFGAFLDGYASSIDIFPVCHSFPQKRSVDALWGDFVTVAQDVNKAASGLHEEQIAHED